MRCIYIYIQNKRENCPVCAPREPYEFGACREEILSASERLVARTLFWLGCACISDAQAMHFYFGCFFNILVPHCVSPSLFSRLSLTVRASLNFVSAICAFLPIQSCDYSYFRIASMESVKSPLSRPSSNEVRNK